MKPLPIYRIKQAGEKWYVTKPDGSSVNDFAHNTKPEAERQLELLVAYKICTTGGTAI